MASQQQEPAPQVTAGQIHKYRNDLATLQLSHEFGDLFDLLSHKCFTACVSAGACAAASGPLSLVLTRLSCVWRPPVCVTLPLPSSPPQMTSSRRR